MAKLKQSAKILSAVLTAASKRVSPGIRLDDLDRFVEAEILSRGGRPSFKGFQGYPCASCLSVNQAIVHGLPSSRALKHGDIVGIDLGVEFSGWYTDGATTVPVGTVDDQTMNLIRATKEALKRAVAGIRPGIRVGAIASAIEQVARGHHVGIIRTLTGHGIGKHFHEPPQIPNFTGADRGPTINVGEVLAIEPMFSSGSGQVRLAPDGWTVVCTDGIGSHHEATVLVTKTGSAVLTTII